MSRRVSYRIIERPDGRFDIMVRSASGRSHFRQGLATPADVEAAIAQLRALMAACGTEVAEEPPRGLAAE